MADRFTRIGLKIYGVKDDNCIICKHCTDIFYDSQGPYMVICELGRSCDGCCSDFIEDRRVLIDVEK